MPLHDERVGKLVADLWATTLPIVAVGGFLFLASIILVRSQART